MTAVWQVHCFMDAEDAAEDAVDMEVAVGLPFVPAVGMFLAVTVGGDYFEVDQVFWHVEQPASLSVYLKPVTKGRIEQEDYLAAQGWQRSGG